MRKFIIFFIKYNDEQNLVENVQVMEPEKAQDYISFMDATWTKGQYARTTHVMGASEALQYVIDTISKSLSSSWMMLMNTSITYSLISKNAMALIINLITNP